MNSFSPSELLKKLRYGDRIHAERDWLMLVFVSFLVLVISGLWNLAAFQQVAAGGTLTSPPATTPAVFDHTSLTAVEQVFIDRAAAETKYATGAYVFTDPSK